MTEELDTSQTWKQIITDFLEKKKQKEEEKFLKDKIKGIEEIYEEKNYFGDQTIKSFFDSQKTKKEKDQSGLEFQRQRLEKILSFEQKPDTLDVAQITRECKNKHQDIAVKFESNQWLSEASKNASSVNFATHVVKLTHSKIDSPSIYDQVNEYKPNIVSTSGLKEKVVDGAVSGNQFAPIYQFLELELNGEKLASLFADEKTQVLKPFTSNEEDLSRWNKGFRGSLLPATISSHSLAKQIYFPVNNELAKYHLLCQVKSSSLAQAIYEELTDVGQKQLKKVKEQKTYSNLRSVYIPSKAAIKVTASNHGNASQLNGKRGGKLFLFSCQPPTWVSQLKAPIHDESLFYAIFLDTTARATIDYLRDCLLRYQEIDLSIKEPKRRDYIDQCVHDIIEDILAYAADIQNLPAGWSDVADIKLKSAHQYFLDPYREDEAFQSKRNTCDWQKIVCSDFASWLNRKLIGREKKFTPQQVHTRIWKDLFEQLLREHNQLIETDRKAEMKRES